MRFLRKFLTIGVALVAVVVTMGLAAAPANASESYYYPLQSGASGDVIDVQGGSLSAGAPIIQWYNNGTSNQLWKFPANDGQDDVIKNQNSGMCLTTDGIAGHQLFQEPCYDGSWFVKQIWVAHTYTVPSPWLGTFTEAWFTNPASGLVIDVNHESGLAGAAIIGWYGTGWLNQSWIIGVG